jgi:hypothetical protein
MSTARERGRRKLVALVMFIYLLLIFEGAVRKWMFPSLGQWLFFVRDPFVLMAYVLALRHGFVPKENGFMLAGIAFGLLALLLVGAQTVSQGGSAGGTLLAVYGWRNYFFYIPLAFVIGEAFERPDIERVVRWTLILAVPTAVLMFLQFVAPLDSPINVGIGADKSLQFHGLDVDSEHTRPMGFFTSDIGEKEFAVSALAMTFSLWLLPAARRFVRFWLLLPLTCAVLACLAVSGSRGAIVHSGILLIAAITCAFVLRGASSSARAVIWPSVIAVLAVVLYPILFPDAAEAFVARWTRAAAVESHAFGSFGIFGRALYSFIDFFNLMGHTPLVGYGLGVAGNARLILGIEIEGLTGWAETDWARHIVDLGPVVGVVFIVYRIAFAGWLGLRCVGGARRTNDPMPLLLFAFVGVELLYGLMTGHGSVNGYVWLFTGFCLAAAKPSFASTAAEDVRAPLVSQPRFANLMR